MIEDDFRLPKDSDLDGLPDYWEDAYGPLLAGNDDDNDGLTNLEEYRGFMWGPAMVAQPIGAGQTYQSAAYVPEGAVKHFRTDPIAEKDLFVKFTDYETAGYAIAACGGKCPFAVGAAAAAVLAFLGVSVPIQLVTFVVISVIFLAVLQRFAKKEQDDTVAAQAGANRFVGKLAIVIEPVKYLDTTGMVRMGTEEWRAAVDSDIVIPKGARVEVVEVRGTRLVVKPIPPAAE